MYSLAHDTGWEPYDLHGLANIFMVRSGTIYHTDHAQHLIITDTGSTVYYLFDLYDLYDLQGSPSECG